MRLCPTCGRSFDERRYQVLALGAGSFDRIDCASAGPAPAAGPRPARARAARRHLRPVPGG